MDEGKVAVRKSTYTDWILNIMLVIMLVLVGILTYWRSADYDILTVQEMNYKLDQKVYHRGDTLNIHIQFCKNINMPERIFSRFVDGVIFNVPNNISNLDVGCYDTMVTNVVIPDTLPAGNYIYEDKYVYQVNPLRTVEYTFVTCKFEVVE